MPDGIHIFKPKIPNWENFGGPYSGRCGICYGHLVYFIFNLVYFVAMVNFMVIWYIFPLFGMLYEEKSGAPVPECRPGALHG
jgi:hypothetical protein